MQNDNDELIKRREIHFCHLHSDSSQAQTAMFLLSDVAGIQDMVLINDLCLHISYDISHISLELIETVLQEVGFHLDNSLLIKIKRALYYYSENVQRDNLGYVEPDNNSTQKVFISKYQQREHGCRDERPTHWRKYL